MKAARPINIAITAMGGQGGGVLADWITALGQSEGYLAQATSVPGVAQRTGATIYYVELFPKSAIKREKREPVLALNPVPGDLDIVIASEMMEAGRAMFRGFVSAKTTLIASDHRVYAISEKQQMGDGRKSTDAVQVLAAQTAGRFISFDMAAAAEETRSIISSVLFGALAGSGALPFPRTAFEHVIRQGGKAVEANLRGFANGFKSAGGNVSEPAPELAPELAPESERATIVSKAPAKAVQPLLQRLQAEFAAPTHDIIVEGLKRAVDFQDVRYGMLYLDQLSAIHTLDKASNGGRHSWRLTRDVARYLALKMTFEDTIRVADLKTRASRFIRFRGDVGARDGQIITVTEFMHPRVEEFCETLPVGLARLILGSKRLKGALGVFFKKGRRVQTTSLRGFLLLRALAALKPMRRMSLRYQQEQARCAAWMALMSEAAPQNYALACEIAGLQRLIKGYGDTYARGLGNYQRIMQAYEKFQQAPNAALTLKKLKQAALQDEEGLALQKALDKLEKGKKT